jgi:hypothetical protein
MASIVILGHGGFDQASTEYPPVVLVPPATTLRFFSDAGQPLAIPAKASTSDPSKGISDYDAVVNVWEHFKEGEAPIPAGWVTYNYELAPDDTEEEYNLGRSLDWGATVVSVAPGGANMRLCNGTADTCPTPALRVQQQEFEKGTGQAVDAERWNHHCTGVLGQQAGNDIIWMACSGFMRATPELSAFETGASFGPGTQQAIWSPDDAAWGQVNEINRQTIKDAEDGDTLPLYVGGVLALVGSGHPAQVVDYVRRQTDLEYGDLTVTKGGTFGSGKLTITGVMGKQSIVEAALEEISDKKVKFE